MFSKHILFGVISKARPSQATNKISAIKTLVGLRIIILFLY